MTSPDTSDSPALRPVAKEAGLAQDSSAKAPAADAKPPGSPLRLGLELTVQLPHVPDTERERIARRARETMEQAISREFRHWETRTTTCAAWLPVAGQCGRQNGECRNPNGAP